MYVSALLNRGSDIINISTSITLNYGGVRSHSVVLEPKDRMQLILRILDCALSTEV